MVHNIYVTRFEVTPEGEEVISQEKTLQTVQVEDEMGQVVQVLNYDELNGELVREIRNKYNEKGELVREEHRYMQDDIEYEDFNAYQYDETGRMTVKMEQFYGDDTVYTTQYIYEGDLLMQVDHYINESFDYTETEFEYQDNRLVKETHYDEYEELVSTVIYHRDENGWVNQWEKNEIRDKDRRTVDYSYDENGNPIKILTYNYKNTLIHAQYLTYDELNRDLVTEWEDLDKKGKIVKEYQGKLIHKIQLFNAEDQPETVYEYFYNDEGQIKETHVYRWDPFHIHALYLAEITTHERAAE
ncbi:MAG TPA: hypothetical protein GX007_00435 [Bacteroidales bacterium]|nr:hypothetical protein [Bacteroidales bacterium]